MVLRKLERPRRYGEAEAVGVARRWRGGGRDPWDGREPCEESAQRSDPEPNGGTASPSGDHDHSVRSAPAVSPAVASRAGKSPARTAVIVISATAPRNTPGSSVSWMVQP